MKDIIKKLLTLIITLFIVSLLAFLAFSVIPGDPTLKMLGTEATPEAIAALRAQLGLDRPVFVRYFVWLGSFITGDFGTSYTYSLPVGAMLADKLPTTALLTLISFILTVVISIPLGIWAGSIKNKVVDHIVISVDQILMSIPAFFVGVIVCFTFGLSMRLFVPGSFIKWSESPSACMGYLFFPALSIAIPRIAMTAKMLKASISSELGKDYVRTARSRGCSRNQSLLKHVVHNSLIPVVTFLAVGMAEIVTSSIIIEQVFAVPGIGRLLLSSITARDFPVVQAIVVILAAWIVFVNFLADLINKLVDPRLRVG